MDGNNNEMAKPLRAMSFGASREQDVLRDFKFECKVGEWTGRLVAKAWGKSSNLICYFEDVATGEKYVLHAFRSKTEARKYTPKDDQIDFSVAGIEGSQYRLVTAKNPKGKPSWVSAVLVQGV